MKFRYYKFGPISKKIAEKIINGKRSNFKFQNRGYFGKKKSNSRLVAGNFSLEKKNLRFAETSLMISLQQINVPQFGKNVKKNFCRKKIQLQVSKLGVFCDKKIKILIGTRKLFYLNHQSCTFCAEAVCTLAFLLERLVLHVLCRRRVHLTATPLP